MRKKLLSLMALLLTAVTGAWAATESSGNQGNNNEAISGTSYSVAGTSVAGKGSVKQGNMPDKGVKLRSTTPLVFSVKEGYAITKLEFWGCGNTETAVTIVSATVDGGSNLLGSNVVLPGKGTTDAVKSGDIVLDDIYATNNITLSFAEGSTAQIVGTWKITYETAAVALAINTQPVSAVYATGATAEALTVSAKGGTAPYTYQWYSCEDAEKTNPSALAGKTASSYTPSTSATGYYFCKVTDSATPTPAEVESNVATITVSAATAPSKPVITGIPGAAVAKGAEVTLTASSTGLPEPTYEWFQCDNAEKANSVSKATTASYSPTTADAGTYYFYAVATNSEGSTASDVVTLTVNPSTACKLEEVKYSNSFNAFIKQPVGSTHGTVKAYYIEGTSAPDIKDVTISSDASYTIVGDELTVTAEDGETTAVFDITVEAVTPYFGDGTELTFDGTEEWVKTGYVFNSGEGWKISKPIEDSTPRVSEGRCRLYFFLAPGEKISVKNIADSRKVDIYRNGTKIETDKTLTKDTYIDIAGDADKSYMLELVSKDNGDTKLKTIKVTSSTVDVTVTAAGWASFSSAKALDFTGTDVKAYIAKKKDGSTVTLTEIEKVPASTGIVVSAASAGTFAIPVLSSSADDTAGNLLKPWLIAGTPTDDTYYTLAVNGSGDPVFKKSSGGTLAAGKAYLVMPAGSAELTVDFGEENGEDITTSIDTIEHSPLNIEHSEVYNLNGQHVGKPTKGLYIVNGKKVVVK